MLFEEIANKWWRAEAAGGPVPITRAMRDPWDQIVGKVTAQRLGISINTTIQGHI